MTAPASEVIGMIGRAIRGFPEGYVLRASYPVTCTECGSSWSMRPGLAMQAGMNTGHWTCGTARLARPDATEPLAKCSAFHHVYIDTDTDTAVSRPWDDAVAEDGAAWWA